MAKAAIRDLKERRFWTWLCVEIYDKAMPKKPIKQYRKHRRVNWRKLQRACDKTVAWVLDQVARNSGGAK